MVETELKATCCASGDLSGAATHQIEIVTLDGAATMDALAFLSVFEEANRLHTACPAYSVSIASLHERCSSAGSLADRTAAPLSTTVIITGTSNLVDDCCRSSHTRAWQRALSHKDRVVACSGGTFLLASLGLLKSRAAVVHWAMQKRFLEQFPSVTCDSTKLYTEDCGIYTCAGGVACFDCALTLVEQDFGSRLAGNIARSLLLHHRRCGDTDQVSTLLQAQIAAPDMLTRLLTWLPEHLQEDLSVGLLASRAAMSPRNFARIFQQRTGFTPARYVERLRLNAAQCQLRNAGNSLSQTATASGFKTVETLRRVFLKRLGVTPGRFRQLRTGPPPQQAAPLSQHRGSFQ